MSTGASKKLPDLNEDAAKELLKEYTEKLLDLRERARKLAQALEQARKPLAGLAVRKIDGTIEDGLFDLWKMLKPPAKRLAQYVSQTIEHGRIDPLTDIELRLRLAEYEHQFLTTDTLITKLLQNSVPVGP